MAAREPSQAIAAGLLRRVADQHDGRRSPLELTAGGRAYLERVHQYRRSQFARAMSGWTDQDRETFADLLTRFITALDQPDTGRSGPPRQERAAPPQARDGPKPQSPPAQQPPPDPAQP